MSNQKKTEFVTLRMAKPLRDELQRAADEEASSISIILRRLVMSWAAERMMNR